MQELSPSARVVYAWCMVGAVLVDLAVLAWLFAGVGAGAGVGFLVTGAWIGPVAVHVMAHAVADSSATRPMGDRSPDPLRS